MLVAALMSLIMTLVSEKKIQPLIAKALRTNLNKSIELSMKAVSSLLKFKSGHLLTAWAMVSGQGPCCAINSFNYYLMPNIAISQI